MVCINHNYAPRSSKHLFISDVTCCNTSCMKAIFTTTSYNATGFKFNTLNIKSMECMVELQLKGNELACVGLVFTM